jgi:hypothetical protein
VHVGLTDAEDDEEGQELQDAGVGHFHHDAVEEIRHRK